MTKKLVEKILDNTQLYDKILFLEKPEDIQKMVELYHKKEDFRTMLATALDTHYRGIAKFLNKLYEKDQGGPAFVNQLEIFLAFIKDPEAGVKILFLFENI